MSSVECKVTDLRNDLDVVWKRIQGRLREIYGEAAYNNWLSVLRLVQKNGSEVELSINSRFKREWISVHYANAITSLWQDEYDDVYKVNIKIAEEEKVNATPTTQTSTDDDDLGGLSSPLCHRFTFANFVVGKSNELAFTAAQRVADSIEPVQGSNPLFLYGGVGLGKTHLMNAIAWYITQKNALPKRKVVYLSAEKFMYSYITALRNRDIMMFKERCRSVDVLMVDDVQFISGKESTQEEFFHTFNALIDQNKQLVISADRSPSDLDGVEDRIKSRLGWGLVADINDTTFELRLSILHDKVRKMNIILPHQVLDFLAENIKSNIRELEGALNKVIAHTSLLKSQITVDMARDILSDLLRSNQKMVGIEDIQREVAERFKIKIGDMHSSNRQRSLARPRQIAMYLCKRLTSKSLPDIGRSFGGRDHATVIHAIKQVESLLGSDQFFAKEVEELLKNLK